MNTVLPDFSQARVLVVGDVMLDRYWQGTTSRISPEAPVPVVHVAEREERPGGAGNVALNLAALGTTVHLLGVCGDDEPADVLSQLLSSAGVACHLERKPHLPTITKLRVLSSHQQLIRLDFEDNISEVSQTQYEVLLSEVDVVVLSDYGKGALNKVAGLIALANKHKRPVLVDPKGRDFSIYAGASLITPNRLEFEAVVGPCANDVTLVEKGQALMQTQRLQNLLITRGSEGMTLLSRQAAPLHLPTQAQEVFDVTGAGDTVIALLAAGLACGSTYETAAFWANVGAGVVVGKLGTATVNQEELAAKIRPKQPLYQGLLSEEALQQEIQTLQATGEKIVMTNGCFDLLHPGHMAYLAQARALGDRLVVAINSDASVKRLKGDERPINPLKHRMLMLLALNMVDWVISFEEDTPKRIIDTLLPDILVKGGDWAVEDIVGSDVVLARGGEVHSLQFLDGFSSTALIEKIKKLN